MDRNPLVTVVIPSYNHQSYVSQSIKSVLNQTYKNIELIVIDDGSEDKSVKYIKKLAIANKFKFIARKNKGLAATLNEGIRLAKGEYICFLASDDYFLLNRIEHALLEINGSANKIIAVCSDGFVINNENKKTMLFSDLYPRPKIGNIYDNLIIGNWIPAMGMTYKTKLLKKFMFDERFRIEDYTLYLRVFKNKKFDVLFYKSCDFCYRQHTTNISNIKEVMFYEFILIQKHFRDVKRYAYTKNNFKDRNFNKILEMNRRDIYLIALNFLRTISVRLNNSRLKIVKFL
jgi:alpha-1,3-rhamnosyltransferase